MSSETDSASAPSSASIPALGQDSSQTAREKAAGKIQRTYRGHRTRRELRGLGLDASTRWTELIRDVEYRNLTTPTAPSDGTTTDRLKHSGAGEDCSSSLAARKNWHRVGTVDSRARGDDISPTRSTTSFDDETSSSSNSDSNQGSIEERRKRRQKRVEARNAHRRTAKMLDLQYFLEMVDQKHRYGSSLRKYHNYWKTQPTSQNFFYWLDHGDGKDVELPECDRARLEREQVRYLSREERLSYLVNVDNQGRLRWAKNGERVWTKDAWYTDSIKGIVPVDDQGSKFRYNVRPDGMESDASSTNSEEDENDEHEADTRYVNEDFHDAKGVAKLKEVSPAIIFNHIIRGHMKKGHKWIFVADTSFRLYIGIKQSGAFQHSSFLQGARISAAGLIKVKDGQLRSLAPLSGHYRPPAANFRSFIHNLQDDGVDLSRVSISKSFAVLVGMESYTRTKQKVNNVKSKLEHEKDKVFHPEKVRQLDEQQKDKSQSAEKERQHLEKLRLEDEKSSQGRKKDESLSAKIVRKLAFGGRSMEDNNNDNREGQTSEVRGVPGVGPEDGVPAPEGNR